MRQWADQRLERLSPHILKIALLVLGKGVAEQFPALTLRLAALNVALLLHLLGAQPIVAAAPLLSKPLLCLRQLLLLHMDAD